MIDNTADVIDSREIIERIEQLRAIRQAGPVPEGVLDDEDYEIDQDSLFAELASLEKLAEQASTVDDWEYGEQLIRDSYFTEYTRELIADCYEMPKDFDQSAWPWRHMQIDYEAAAQELLSDYIDIDFDGVTYWARG